MSDISTHPASNNCLPPVEADVHVAGAGASADAAAAAPSHLGEEREIKPEPELDTIQNLLPAVLSRIASGLPMHELSTIIKEACACENALEREIEILERVIGNCTKSSNQCSHQETQSELPLPLSPLIESTMISIPRLPLPYQPGGEPGKGHINYLDSADAMLETEFSPPDRYFAISALLGRLREPMKLPYPPNSLRAADFSLNTKSKKNEQELEERKIRLALEKQQSLLQLDESEIYHMEQPDTTALLALHKKISSHRTAAVFRKPVNPAEAPGYTERIPFPMDLSLVRKLIVARVVKSFSSFHQCIGLICHNCVKFNGRESDYAVITREFEDHVDDKVLEAVRSATSADAVVSVGATITADATVDNLPAP